MGFKNKKSDVMVILSEIEISVADDLYNIKLYLNIARV